MTSDLQNVQLLTIHKKITPS